MQRLTWFGDVLVGRRRYGAAARAIWAIEMPGEQSPRYPPPSTSADRAPMPPRRWIASSILRSIGEAIAHRNIFEMDSPRIC